MICLALDVCTCSVLTILLDEEIAQQLTPAMLYVVLFCVVFASLLFIVLVYRYFCGGKLYASLNTFVNLRIGI